MTERSEVNFIWPKSIWAQIDQKTVKYYIINNLRDIGHLKGRLVSSYEKYKTKCITSFILQLKQRTKRKRKIIHRHCYYFLYGIFFLLWWADHGNWFQNCRASGKRCSWKHFMLWNTSVFLFTTSNADNIILQRNQFHFARFLSSLPQWFVHFS